MEEDLYPLDRTYWKHRLPLAPVAQCVAHLLSASNVALTVLRMLGVLRICKG